VTYVHGETMLAVRAPTKERRFGQQSGAASLFLALESTVA
jgi:hypothetical protein